MIGVSGLCLRAGSRTLIEDATFSIAAGTMVAVLGPNGAGKTTLLRTLAGVHAPARGAVTIDAVPLKEFSAARRARAIAQVVTDEVFGDRLTVYDVVSLGRHPYRAWWEWTQSAADDEAIGRALEDAGVAHFACRFFETLSSGERARVWIAMALAQQTPIVLLDEPTSHLDVRVSHEILALLRARADAGATILCALHDLNEAAAYADSSILLDGRGRLSHGTLERHHRSGALADAYGVPLERIEIDRGRLVFVVGATT